MLFLGGCGIRGLVVRFVNGFYSGRESMDDLFLFLFSRIVQFFLEDHFLNF